MSEKSSSAVDFLIRLKKIDLRGLTVRDMLVLYTIITKPGISGMEISTKLGFKDRASIQSNVNRLIREGYIEDRREHQRKAYATILHVLPAGLIFWDEIKP